MHMCVACYLCGVVYLSLCFTMCSASVQERVPAHPVDGQFIDGWLIKSPWKSYTIHDGLVYNWARAIHHGPDGTLWFGTARGLSRYDGQTFVNFTAKDGLANDNVRTIYREPNGIMWFGTWGNGVFRYEGRNLSISL